MRPRCIFDNPRTGIVRIDLLFGHNEISLVGKEVMDSLVGIHNDRIGIPPHDPLTLRGGRWNGRRLLVVVVTPPTFLAAAAAAACTTAILRGRRHCREG